MKYSDRIDEIVKSELTNLINMVRRKEMAFEPGQIEKIYQEYLEILSSKQ